MLVFTGLSMVTIWSIFALFDNKTKHLQKSQYIPVPSLIWNECKNYTKENKMYF